MPDSSAMRSKGGMPLAVTSEEMGDKQKSAKKSKFRFRGGSSKKENGAVPGLASHEDGIILEEYPIIPASTTYDGYTLSNADVINGGIGYGRGVTSYSPITNNTDDALPIEEHLVCTCPVPPPETSPYATTGAETSPRATTSPHSPGSQLHPVMSNGIYTNGHPNKNSYHGNLVSVVAVIEDGSKNGGQPGSTVSSNNSSSSASICSVRPKVPVPNPQRTLVDIMSASPQRPLMHHGDHGNRSPSNQSLISMASSTVAMDLSGEAPFSRFGSERSKQTLGDIIMNIDAKAKVLLTTEDFTVIEPYSDLQFLAHQSRYNSDVHIKRRLIAKLVDCNVVDIFLRVFDSVHSVDYLVEEGVGNPLVNSAIGATDVANAPSAGENGLSESSQQLSDAGNSDNKVSDEIEVSNGSKASGLTLIHPALKNLRAAITLLWNTTDKSPILCEECIKRGLIQILLEDLKDPRLTTSEIKDQQRLYLVKGYLGILNNIICFYNDTREIFRDAGAIKILQPYLKSQLLLVKTKTIMLLSYIINESENDVINASDKNIGFTIKMLEATLEKDNHYSRKFGFWAVEVAAGLNRLGGFENNKERIVLKGALPLYLQLLQRPCSEDEQLIASQGVWILSYCPRTRDLICEDTQIINALHSLADTSSRDEIKLAASGALWVLEGRGSGVGAVPKSPKLPAGAGHIYISYHWTCKHFVVRLRDKLRSFGYKVFVDVDNMGTCGLPLKTVFEALEKTCVFIMCVTQKYKDSPFSRNEAEQASRLRRDIIPLRLQQRYNPDGWLSDVIGNKLIFDFSREEHLENVTMALVRELGHRGRSKSSLVAAAAAASVVMERDASRSPSNQSVASAVTAGSQGAPLVGDLAVSKVCHWTETEVAHWLMDNGLTSVIDRFQSITGELLFEMRKMHQMAPESFFTMLRSELAFDWITQLKFTKALDKL